jgi:2-polyprenyl-3-methyl-5-hydroxy-6-metoxy-1,4-benzoquinol methylase
MVDVRSQLYDRYVSTFKRENASLTPEELSHYFKWCDARYFPFLKSLEKSSSILELGCGHGRILNYLRHKGFTNAKGIDISKEQIELARKDGLDAECADVFTYLDTSTPSFSRRGSIADDARGGYDCVIAIDFIEHFTKEELFRLFELLRSAMKPGGVLLLQTVNGEGLFPGQIIYGDLTHSTILSPGSLTQLLSAVGFHDIVFSECAPVASGVAGVARSLAWKIVRAGANAIRLIESNKTQQVWTENFICVAEAQSNLVER